MVCILESSGNNGSPNCKNEKGEEAAAMLPIELWREIESEREAAYLLSSPKMRQRLTEALSRTGGLSLDSALAKLGV